MPRPKKGTKGHEEAVKKWRKTIEEKYGSVSAFMAINGAIGGKSGSEGKGFAKNPEKAKACGKLGGQAWAKKRKMLDNPKP